MIVRVYGPSLRDRQVAELVLRGLPTKQVARALERSLHTVTDYLRSLFDKVGVCSRRGLRLVCSSISHLRRFFGGAEIRPDGWVLDDPNSKAQLGHAN